MFANFLYFIVVILIYETYQPADAVNFSAFETFGLFVGLTVFFFAICRLLFQRIEKRAGSESMRILDRNFTATQQRLLVMAVGLFAVDVYALNLPDFLNKIPVLGDIPTFQALIAILIFFVYSIIVWGTSHTVFRRISPSPLGRSAYILSNISFAVPVLIPWFVLSTLIDIIYALPFDFIKRILSSSGGEFFCLLLFLAAVVIIGPALIKKFWRCKSLPEGPVRERIETICRKAGVPYRDIVDWPVFGGHMITAGVMGLVKRFRYILVTRALLAHLSPDELDAVIAHEAAHVKKKHLLLYLLFLTGFMLVISGAMEVLSYQMLKLGPVSSLMSAVGYRPVEAAHLLQGIIMIGSFLIYFRYVFGYFMRNFERQADAYAFSMIGTAVPLVSTFRKIAFTSGQSADKPNWHHFSIRQRIDFLEQCDSDPTTVARHNRKVSRNIAIFVIALLFLGSIGFYVNLGNGGRRVTPQVLEEILHRAIEKDPGNADLFATLGDLYYGLNDYEKTVDAYEHALAIEFDLPHVLNNLAWLYATCEESAYRDARRALMLSQRAAELDPSPETLDTLGESYYVNGDFDAAIAAEKAAVALGGKNPEYYETQLEKFKAAAAEKDASEATPGGRF